jgi:hypothetical protein
MFITIFEHMKALLFFMLLGLSIPMCAQFLENDFSQTDLSDWQGDTQKFVVANNQLQLNDATAGTSNVAYLSIAAPTSLTDETIWECWVRLDFSPSGSNFARIYLSASNADLAGPLKAYYLKIGGISGSDDAIELFRQDGTSSTSLLSGVAGAVGGSMALAKVKISRTAGGLWSMEVDYTGGDAFQLEGTVVDTTYKSGTYFGIYCQYSSTRSENFFFDDILVDPLFEDQMPPVLLSATTVNQNTLSVQFDEAIDPAIATNTDLYTLSNGFGNPLSAQPSPDDPTVMLLQFDQDFTNLSSYTLTVEGVADEAGNPATAQSVDFTYLDIAFPLSGDLIVTEMMVDPAPSIGLPTAEYVELYNASDKVLELAGVEISTGGTPRELPPHLLLPDAYVLLTDTDDISAFAAFGPSLGIDGFPALTNSGDQLTLRSRDSELLVDINYDVSWYRDNDKTDGGWSLELIQINRTLDCPGNWTASIANSGGTPGQENSVHGVALETDGPMLLSVYPIDELEIVLRFDESLDFSTASDPMAYTIDGGISVIAAFPQPGANEVILSLNTPLQTGLTYTVEVNTRLSDCLGNPVDAPTSRRLGLPELAEVNDIVINELLFFPEIGGKDFIELYNRSEKIINLFNWRIRSIQEDGSARQETISSDFLIFPGEFVVITEEPQDILDRYIVNFPERLLANDLPTIGDEGQLLISNANFIQIDSFAYSDDLHSPLLDEERGVSLERVDTETPTSSPGNWHSAAASVGFATPTDENSQYRPLRAEGSNVINLAQKRFSPDGDGFEDVLLLQVETDRPGYLATAQVFDANGRLVRRLLRNELLPTAGVYKWDGSHPDGHKARIGIYVLWVELVNPDGTVERWKESFVLAGQLD